jgi:DnaJ-class molecular chaperone
VRVIAAKETKVDASKDYYNALGVTKTSSQEEIKKSYRELAKKYHPDRHEGDKVAEERFKSISEAYDTIGDPKKRAEYDQLRENPFANRSAGSSHSSNAEFDMGDIFSSFFAGNRSREHQRQRQQQQSLEPTQLNLSIPFQLALKGGDYLYMTPSGKRVKLKIPANCLQGHKLKISAQGRHGEDVILSVSYLLPPTLTISGLNVIQTIDVNVFDAILGKKMDVELYNSKSVSVTIKAGTSSHTKLKLPKMGLTRGSEVGDCLLEIRLMLPKQLTDEQEKILEQLKYKTTV